MAWSSLGIIKDSTEHYVVPNMARTSMCFISVVQLLLFYIYNQIIGLHFNNHMPNRINVFLAKILGYIMVQPRCLFWLVSQIIIPRAFLWNCDREHIVSLELRNVGNMLIDNWSKSNILCTMIIEWNYKYSVYILWHQWQVACGMLLLTTSGSVSCKCGYEMNIDVWHQAVMLTQKLCMMSLHLV